MSNSSIQSIIFDRSFWTLQEAKAWLKKHNLKDDVDVKPNTYRFRQKNPNPKYNYFTYTLPDKYNRGPKLVIYYHK